MNLKELRLNAKLRGEEVAAHLGIALSTLRNWEQGRTIPKLRIDQIEELLKFYNCSFTEFLNAYKETKFNKDNKS